MSTPNFTSKHAKSRAGQHQFGTDQHEQPGDNNGFNTDSRKFVGSPSKQLYPIQEFNHRQQSSTFTFKFQKSADELSERNNQMAEQQTERQENQVEPLLSYQMDKSLQNVFHKNHSIKSHIGSEVLEHQAEFIKEISIKRVEAEGNSLQDQASENQKRATSKPRLRRSHTIMSASLRGAQQPQARWIILPKNQTKQVWDFLMIGLLFYVTIFTPYRIGFINDGEYPAWDIFDNMVDFFYLFDLCLTFFTAFYDEDNKLVTERRKIASNYLKGWFFIDLLSSIPFYLMIEDASQKFNSLARISKLPKIYRAVKMVKLARMIKFRDLQYFKIINVNVGSERLFFACLTLLLSCHVVACVWFFVASISEDPDWMYAQPTTSAYDQYVVSLYWCVQTVLTVGYGNVEVNSWQCRLFAIFWMILSVYVFSFAVGSLASVLDRMDQANQTYLRRLQILKNIKKQYSVPDNIFQKVKRELKTGMKNVSQNYHCLLEDLPASLRIELGYAMHKGLGDEISYFKGKANTFIATIGPLLTTLSVGNGEYLYQTGDPAEEVYFIKSGKLAIVLPQYCDFKFMIIKPSIQVFGELDILYYGEKRKYTVKTTQKCEFYVLSRRHFKQIYFSLFRDEGQKLINESKEKKQKIREAYMQAITFLDESNRELPPKPILHDRNFYTSVNSISSKEASVLNLNKEGIFVFKLASNITKLNPIIHEEKEEEEQDDDRFAIMDRNAMKKKIAILEKNVKDKEETIKTIQGELDDVLHRLEAVQGLSNCVNCKGIIEAGFEENYRIGDNFQQQLQLRRDLKARSKLQGKKSASSINISEFTPRQTTQQLTPRYNQTQRKSSITFEKEASIVLSDSDEKVVPNFESFQSVGLKIAYNNKTENVLNFKEDSL